MLRDDAVAMLCTSAVGACLYAGCDVGCDPCHSCGKPTRTIPAPAAYFATFDAWVDAGRPTAEECLRTKDDD